jgi:hypothetical protein
MSDSGIKTVASIEALFTAVRDDRSELGTATFPWFRGEPTKTETPLLPVLFRESGQHDENRLLQRFRQRALSLGTAVPHRDHTDQWLFLARHVGLPTRLLDWTEGLMFALWFAVHDAKGGLRDPEEGGTVWMLDPDGLNRLSVPPEYGLRDNETPLTWVNQPTLGPTRQEVLSWLIATLDDSVAKDAGFPDTAAYLDAIRTSMRPNIGAMNINRAWGAPRGTELPVAVHPTTVHARITAQKGCFTVHGDIHKSLSALVEPPILRRYRIEPKGLGQIRDDLRLAGVTYSTMFPDLDGLSTELCSWF